MKATGDLGEHNQDGSQRLWRNLLWKQSGDPGEHCNDEEKGFQRLIYYYCVMM